MVVALVILFLPVLARSALQKFTDRLRGSENGPGRNRQQDGKEERFDGKLPPALMRKIMARQFA